MRLRRFLAAACVLAAVAPAVPASAASAKALVRGRVLDGNGRPVHGATVTLRAPDLGLFGALYCLFGGFLVDPACHFHQMVTKTDSAGRYTFALPLNSYIGQSGTHPLVVDDVGGSTALPAARTSTKVQFDRKSLTLPDLRLWRAAVSVDPALPPTHRTLHVDPMPAAYGDGGSGATVELFQGNGVVWTYGSVDDDRLVDTRTVEAGTTSIRAMAGRTVSGLKVLYQSRAFPVTKPVTPVSRGKACFTYGAKDVVLPYAGCTYTDGKLAVDPDFKYAHANWKQCSFTTECAHPNAVVVDLGAVQVVNAISTRGCKAPFIETSAEGLVFTEFRGTTLAEPDLVVGAPVPARYVRVSATFCPGELTELSAFAPL